MLGFRFWLLGFRHRNAKLRFWNADVGFGIKYCACWILGSWIRFGIVGLRRWGCGVWIWDVGMSDLEFVVSEFELRSLNLGCPELFIRNADFTSLISDLESLDVDSRIWGFGAPGNSCNTAAFLPTQIAKALGLF